jgi:hypothetical protein
MKMKDWTTQDICNDLLKTITLLRYLTVNMLSLQLLKRIGGGSFTEWKKPGICAKSQREKTAKR